MNLNKVLMVIKMGLDRKVREQLLEVYKIYRIDHDFSLLKYLKMMIRMITGEKILKHEDKYIISTFMPPLPSVAFITNAIAVDNMDKVFSKQLKAERTAPISIYLCVTHKCPNNCLYCSSKNRQQEEELTTNQWKRILKDLQDMNTAIIGITGGEPMIREDIYEIVRFIDQRSTSILFTSGFNLTFRKAKKLKSCGLFGIGISLDSPFQKEHNENRRDDKAFDYALSALRFSNEAGLYTMAQTVILKKDIDEKRLFELFKLAKKYGAHEVKILEPIISGNLLTVENLDEIIYKKEDRKKLIEIQHKANRISSFPKITTFAYTESKEKFGCGAGTQHSYVSADGHLYPCDFVPMSFGNIKEKGIKDLWREMNTAIGNPKLSCFAQKINRQVIQVAQGQLPLNKEKSMQISQQHQTKEMPDYYKI